MLETAKRWACGCEQSRQKSLPHGVHVLVGKTDEAQNKESFRTLGRYVLRRKVKGHTGGEVGVTNPVNVFIMDRCVPYIRKCW